MSYNPNTYTGRELRRIKARAQRIAARQPRRVPKGTGLEGVARLDDCTPYRPGATTVKHIMTRESFARLVDGTASLEDYDRVVIALNLARIRAEEIDPQLAQEVGQTQAAMGRCADRYRNTGRFGFDGPSLQAMRIGLDHHEAITDASSARQMDLARQQMLRNLDRLKTQRKQAN